MVIPILLYTARISEVRHIYKELGGMLVDVVGFYLVGKKKC